MESIEVSPSSSQTTRFLDGVRLATELHGGQTKKAGAPFLAHLLEVCAYVLRAGGDGDQAIAALLHDGPEKSGGRATLKRIEQSFGPRVGKIVADCTDSFDDEDKPGFLVRKEQQIERFRQDALPESGLVYAADKLANAREIHRRLKAEGPQVWQDYGGGRSGHLWYFRAIYAAILERGGVNPLLPELDECLKKLEQDPINPSAASS
ncbi:metal dependent phosphohydrolase [Acidisarcina polymorpha]|uniref:Metal dependent phosphohydrolase n=1 Tax=Acidisarcina polymorpha TaxID=2211140 RepID=A0A2Z5G849_9BACT|nr:HD domain-containing protein [Acidisarcina polymorpha]AXC15221.1 metal dependent phosphohydrolase [Acidisarcina polymorpha]